MESVLPKLGDTNMSKERIIHVRKLIKFYEDSNKANTKLMKKLQEMIYKDTHSVLCAPISYSAALGMKLIETTKG